MQAGDLAERRHHRSQLVQCPHPFDCQLQRGTALCVVCASRIVIVYVRVCGFRGVYDELISWKHVDAEEAVITSRVLQHFVATFSINNARPWRRHQPHAQVIDMDRSLNGKQPLTALLPPSITHVKQTLVISLGIQKVQCKVARRLSLDLALAIQLNGAAWYLLSLMFRLSAQSELCKKHGVSHEKKTYRSLRRSLSALSLLQYRRNQCARSEAASSFDAIKHSSSCCNEIERSSPFIDVNDMGEILLDVFLS
mmetsp:Transcript_8532/g.26662  ORF Transcript_8532/g.26662 Transcript_8532/m.26662 type:complete len:253 (+) Transcript_8532:413-1171(+)